MAQGQRQGGRWRQGGAVSAAADAAAGVVAAAAVAVARQHQVPELRLDVVKAALLSRDAARAVSAGERGEAHVLGSRATAARVRWGNGSRRVQTAWRSPRQHVH